MSIFSDPSIVISKIVHSFPATRVLVAGDVMLDSYWEGFCDRISQEAPVPVVRINRQFHSLGGCANVASNLAALSAGVEVAGCIGNDEAASHVLSECLARGIGTGCLRSSEEFSTTTKVRVLAGGRQMIRVDHESTTPHSQAQSDALLRDIGGLVGRWSPHVVVLSDYAKGVCTPYFCERLLALAGAKQIPVIVDPKGVDYEKYRGAMGMKPNRPEVLDLARARGWDTSDPTQCAQELRGMLGLQFVALSLGSEGLALVEAEGTRLLEATKREVYDVSGAGDTVVAVLAASLASGLDLLDSVTLANLGAGEVVTRVGSVPVSQQQLLLAAHHSRAGGKSYDLEEIVMFADAWRSANEKIVLTNGCFDILHSGHVRLLRDARATGDRLIVAINSDASISRLKGAGRPIMPIDQRITVLSELECVDGLVVFEEDTPLRIIETIKPDVLVKGGDYANVRVVGADFVEANGGKLVLIPTVDAVSTSKLADAISRL